MPTGMPAGAVDNFDLELISSLFDTSKKGFGVPERPV